MEDTDNFLQEPGELPSTAEEILVFNVVNPHHIIVGTVNNRSQQLDQISRKLAGLAKKYSKNVVDPPENGALTLVQGQLGTKAELPAWWCRGVVENYTETTSQYQISLPDHGVTVSLSRNEFITVPPNSLSEDYLAFPIALYHIVPGLIDCYPGNNNKKKYDMVIQKKWSPDAIHVTRCLIAGASKIYFDHIADSGGKKCGEIYLIIDEEVVPLRYTLVHSNFGVHLRNEDYAAIRELESHQPKDEVNDKESVILESPMIEVNDVPSVESKKTALSDDNSICYFDTSLSTSDKESYQEVFISNTRKCQRLTSIGEANFSITIYAALEEMEMKRIWKMPSFMWPAVSKCCDVLAVSPKRTGKTVGYVVPISNLVLAMKDQQEDNYPLVLVLCSSTNAAKNAHDIFSRILAHNADILIVSGFNGVDYRSLTAKLYNGCHIFISTPAYLDRYLSNDHYRKVLNLDYIRHIIFDQLDIILQKQKTELINVLKETCVVKRKCENLKGFTVQLIAVAEQWSTVLGKFTEIFSDPYICIGSHPDAVISCGVQPKLRQIRIADKPDQLVELLGDRYRAVKTLVVCRSRREAAKLKKRIAGQCNILYADGKSHIDEIHSIKDHWNLAISGLYPVLICTDSVLFDLRISDAEWLIHYTIATTTKSIFNFRFSSLISNLKCRQKAMEVTIILDETNDLQLRGVLDLMERSGVKLTKNQLEAADKIVRSLDRKKENFSICDNVKAFGYCSSKFNCPYRHWVLPDVDQSKIPVEEGDTVKLLLTYVHTATHFSGRILERMDFQGQVSKFGDHEHVAIVARVNQYFAVQGNRIRDRNIYVGGIYGFKRDEGHYERVSILNIVQRDADDRPKYVDLKCIDTGLEYRDVVVSGLLELSEELRAAAAHIVEIFLSNIMPYDDEEEWSWSAMNCVKKWIEDNRSPIKFYRGRVQLVLGTTIWVDPLEIKMKITGRRDQQVSTLKSHLVKMNHGVSDDEHIKRLMKLCQNVETTGP
ncbi:putative ATP-dependent RNA helicase TDRD12 [Diachasmimorpha longicaudata]|uniref:putative ATP-dependent RNA helicase TDRD12 n=1 Tax=Diachasmimorpha longicaudata TaxID=58733 RepID=UPI0030B8E406